MLNKIITVTCTELSYQGLGVTREHNKPIFVHDLFVGEKAKVQIYKETTKFAFAKVVELITKSEHRDKSYSCINSAPLINLAYNQQVAFKENYLKSHLIRNLNINESVIDAFQPAIQQTHYRNKIKVPLKLIDNILYYGEYDSNSNNIIVTNDIKIQNNISLNRTLDKIINALNQYSQKSYRYKVLEAFREITLRINHINEVQVLFNLSDDQNVYSEIINILKSIDNIVQLYFYQNQKLKLIFEKKPFSILINKKSFDVHINSFFQINIEMATKIFNDMHKKVSENFKQNFIDLYCGVGIISQLVAYKRHKILGVDISREAIAAAKDNAYVNGFRSAKYINGDVYQVIDLYNLDINDTIVVLDPPRAGLDAKLTKWLNNINSFIYMSCEPRSFIRDLQNLQQQGFKINYIKGYDMFPNTPHFEIVAYLSK
ncbi:23S rRNA (uracil(1939)-C(5))-methyltransferase RlmD [Mycoplasma sp. AC1221]